MLTPALQTALFSVIEKYQQQVNPHEDTNIHDFPSLKNAVIQKELKNELKALTSIFENRARAERRFKRHCITRAKINMDSCVAANTMSFGLCNQLYAEIAQTLYPELTQADLIKLLLPTAKILITPNVIKQDPTKRLALTNLSIEFKPTEIKTLQEPATLSQLSDFVVSGRYLYDLTTIARYHFDLHLDHYNLLSRAYPDLATTLYQHNATLRALKNHLLMFTGSGQPPKHAIQAFIMELRLGGQKMWGKNFATPSAQVAFTDFQGYLKNLPAELNDTLLLLKSLDSTKSFSHVIDDLLNSECVETAASDLQSIIDNPLNQNVLMQVTHSKDAQLEIRKIYRPGIALSITPDESNLLPHSRASNLFWRTLTLRTVTRI